MIHGHKPGGYFVTADGEGHKIEGETRQCVHCQYVWEYHPGSGTERGYCLSCNGFLCARAQCILDQKRLCALMLEQYGRTRSCVPFEEWNSRVREKVERYLPNPELILTDSGILVPRSSL